MISEDALPARIGPEAGARGPASEEWRAHWQSVVTVSIGIACGYALYQFSASQFIAPWQTAFGWSRGEIALAQNGLLLSALLSPLAGKLLDRVGSRRPILICMTMTGLGYLAMACLSSSLIQYYATFLLVQLFGIMTTGLSFTRILIARFEAARGSALAISRVGMSVFGVAVPGIIHLIIVSTGWREAFLFLAAVTLLIGLPVCWIGLHDHKREPRKDAAATPPTGLLRLMRTRPKILLLCLAGGLNYAPLGALLSQLQPLLVSKHVTAGDAAMMGGVYAGTVLIGSLLSGVLVDRIWAPLVGCLFAAGPAIGCALLLQGDDPAHWVAIAAVMLIGMAQGAEIDVIAYLTARYFGLPSYSSIYGMAMMITILCTFSAQVSIGFVYDRFGGYDVALAAAILLLISAIIAYLSLGRYPRPGADGPCR